MDEKADREAAAAAKHLESKKKEAQELRDVGDAVAETINFTVSCRRIGDGDSYSPGTKKVHFIRHGEGHHNVAQKEWRVKPDFVWPSEPYTVDNDPEYSYIDALLTPKGEGQARELQARTVDLAPQLLVVSPMRRATATGILAFEKHVADKSLPVIAHELCHETGGKHTCDKRLKKADLAALYPMIDYSLIEDEEDPLWRDGLTRESKMEIASRAAKFLEWLRARPETHVAVAAHSGWLLSVFNGAIAEADAEVRHWFSTGEMRTVELTFKDK